MVQQITVGMNTCGIANGADILYSILEKKIQEHNLDIPLKPVGCVGMCYREPLVDILSNKTLYTYGEVTPEKLDRIFDEHVLNGTVIEDWIVKKETFEGDYYKIEDHKVWDIDDFFSAQKKIVLENSGYINAESIDEYIKTGGYEGLKIALKSSPEEVIDLVLKSGLRGRGGAGFPTGLKWKFAHKAKGEKKYIICNADEGDPGAFMDRNVIEGDCHRVIEGMIIAAHAIGATNGVVYIRAEYPLGIKRLKIALKEARKLGFLGDNILNSGLSFDIIIKQGAGAFVCGEETAMILSIQGGRGMPRPKPPFPANKGLYDAPTNINNVETFANIPWILRKGWETFADIGMGKSRGTKVFALAGKIKHGGNVEVPMGVPLTEILYKIGGGTKSGKNIKAVQLGGPSGGCIPSNLFETNVTYEDITATGAIVGSGGMVIMDEETCMVDVTKFFLDFTVKESCGKCTFCRLGTKRMHEILQRICDGKGKLEDIDTLKDLGVKVKKGSLCGLGQTAPNPVLTTIKYFLDEFKAHIVDHHCPAAVCKALLTYKITNNCIGCTLCAKSCPVNAIEGIKKEKHHINQDICIKCGSCYTHCPSDAIIKF
ncbi:MAG: NADH-ubiquinone oxidoreductase-F iron-sulfur binding region domain-containing protein [Promethearchaeota archaeon]